MRILSLFLLSGAFLLAACDSPVDPGSREIPDPQFHVVPPGDPALDDAFSMYWFDLDLKNDFVLKLAQENPTSGEGLGVFECSDNPLAHGHLGEYPTQFSNDDLNHPASGFGWFADRSSWPWKRGSLTVTTACWFDEWNGEGFPESAVVWGVAEVRIGFFRKQTHPFQALLKSAGFPAQGHLLQLDGAMIGIPGVTNMILLGELHHEDGTSLVN